MDDTTEVMSLDELMELASEPRTAPVPRPGLLPPVEAPTQQLPTRQAPVPPPPPVSARPARPATEPGQLTVLTTRLRNDGGQLLLDARKWLEADDNALIAGTVLVTLLLLLVVATL